MYQCINHLGMSISYISIIMFKGGKDSNDGGSVGGHSLKCKLGGISIRPSIDLFIYLFKLIPISILRPIPINRPITITISFPKTELVSNRSKRKAKFSNSSTGLKTLIKSHHFDTDFFFEFIRKDRYISLQLFFKVVGEHFQSYLCLSVILSRY